MFRLNSRVKKIQGLTLIEALVSVVVFSFALVGLSFLYSQSITVSHGAYLRSLASIQAMDMAERIAANVFLDVGSEDYEIGSQDSDSITSNGCSSLPTDPDCVANPCATDQLRDWDQIQWCEKTESLFGSLFQGAAITLDGDDYIIGIEWSERDVQSAPGTEVSNFYFSYRMRRPLQ